MIGVRVIQFSDILPVNKAELVTKDPLVLLLRGSGYLLASDVLINGISSPIQKIYNDQTLEVGVPDELKDEMFQSLLVVSDTYSGLSASKIGFGLGNPTKKVTGAVKLMQHFIKLLLTTPDTDIFYKGTGGGLQRMGGVITSSDNAGPLAGKVIASIQRTERQILRSQSGRSMPNNEKLRKAEAVDLTYDKYSSTLMVKVALMTVGGQGVMGSIGL